jgi:hypothetical protein
MTLSLRAGSSTSRGTASATARPRRLHMESWTPGLRSSIDKHDPICLHPESSTPGATVTVPTSHGLSLPRSGTRPQRRAGEVYPSSGHRPLVRNQCSPTTPSPPTARPGAVRSGGRRGTSYGAPLPSVKKEKRESGGVVEY